VVGPRAIRELKFLMCSLQTKTCEDVVGRIWVAKKLGVGEVSVPKEIEFFFFFILATKCTTQIFYSIQTFLPLTLRPHCKEQWESQVKWWKN